MHDPQDTAPTCPYCTHPDVPDGAEPDWESTLDDWAWILRLNKPHLLKSRQRLAPPQGVRTGRTRRPG